jgi:DNA-binding GntR family transcriptional regulator
VRHIQPRDTPTHPVDAVARTRNPLKIVASPSSSRSQPVGATERIVDAITLAIVERRLMPGTKLSEQKLADIFEVSRTLVRQALNQLSRDRLVTLERARGAFVAMPSVDEARQVFEVRAMLEAALARQLCARITDRQIAELRSHLRDEASAVARTDVAGRTRLLADFHAVLAACWATRCWRAAGDLVTRSSLIALMYQSAHSAEHRWTMCRSSMRWKSATRARRPG